MRMSPGREAVSNSFGTDASIPNAKELNHITLRETWNPVFPLSMSK